MRASVTQDMPLTECEGETQTPSKDTSVGEDSVRVWVSVTQDISLAEGEGEIQIASEDTSIGECPVGVRASIENL